MWGILVGLIQAWWRDKPRKDVVRAVVRLRDSMIECQTWYNQYRDAVEANDIDSLSPNPNAEWIRSLDDLRLAISEIQNVLEIFSPDAHNAVNSYIYFEDCIALEQESEEFFASSSSEVKKEAVLDDKFSRALTQLRVFIAQNFKPDEIFAASRKQ